MAVSTGSPGKETRFQPGLRSTSYALARQHLEVHLFRHDSLPAVSVRVNSSVWSPTDRLLEREVERPVDSPVAML